MSVASGVRTAVSEAVGLLVDDWTLFFTTVAALGAAALVAALSGGDKALAGLVLFAGVWAGMFASLLRSARRHRRTTGS
jgi:hypothetical protein